jgi:hypothetical protein
MPEIMAILDAAIAEVGRKVLANSRSSRQRDSLSVDAGPYKALKSKVLPVLPVLPVKRDAFRDGSEGVSKKIFAASNSGDAAPEESNSKSTGSTGSTGTIQDSCVLERSRNFVAYGNCGNSPDSLGDKNERLDEGAAFRSLNGIPAEWLDGMAGLRAIRTLPGIAEVEWKKIVATADEILKRWAVQLAALGWTAADVFGADPHAPWTRLDCMGLALLLRECELTAVTAETAILRTPSGATQRFYRRHPALGQPLWELVF